MNTQCNLPGLEFEPLGKRKVVAEFSANPISSDGGGLLLRQVDRISGICQRLAACFQDKRSPGRIEHTIEELLRQRLFGIALGYEDLVDHDDLRQDPLLAVLTGKADPSGNARLKEWDRGIALAGKSTLDRLESAAEEVATGEKYAKFQVDHGAIERLFVTHFLDAHPKAPKQIILDVDATDDPLHGQQEGRFFHGYYRGYCYLPLYIFCGDFLLAAKLRPANIDASHGTVEELERIVTQIRESWPHTRIVLRADAGFARDALLDWCETHGVYYIVGLAKNPRLNKKIGSQMERARRQHLKTQMPARVFRSFAYQTRSSWSRRRRVIGKAEYLAKGANPRFIVVHLPQGMGFPQQLYESVYCARGDMENRIKEQQLDLFADRTSSHQMASNQLRLWFSSCAYLLMEGIRRMGLKGTTLAKAQCGTIRTKLFKIGAMVHISVRRVLVKLSGGYPYKKELRAALESLQNLARPPDWSIV